jgi:dihydroflavonol-4-reductase
MIVVTGASGLVGGNMLRTLLAAGQTVRALVRDDRRAIQGLEVEPVQADLSDLASLVQAFQGAELVYHLAGAISIEANSWPLMETVNVLGTRHVVEACLRCGVRRLVYFSSIQALEPEPLDIPLDENRPRVSSPRHAPYDRSKAAAEREVQAGIAQGLDAIILNPTAIVGPHDYKPSYFGQAIIRLVQRRIPALVGGGFDWVDVRDVVQGAIQAGSVAACGASYILSGHWHSVREVAGMATELTGTTPPRIMVPMWLAYQAAPVMGWMARFKSKAPIYTRATLRDLQSNRQVSHARASHELGYQPRPFKDTLADTIHWFLENGYLSSRKELP